MSANETATRPSELKPNCSTYNPCGKNGHCRDDDENQWTCDCKFWWGGTYCDTLLNSGRQVIILGVLLGVLLIAFYGLSVSRTIRKKQKLSKTNPQSNRETPSTIVRTFPAVNLHNYHPFRRRLAWLTGLLTALLIVSTLIIKWRLLQPIHDEVIHKYQTNQSFFYVQHSICHTFALVEEFNVITFPVACFLILLFVIITKRMSMRRHQCMRGYVGIPIPLDFFAHVKRTLAAVIFALFADDLAKITYEAIFEGSSNADRGVIVAYLIIISKVFAIGLRRYPILAAVHIDTCLSLSSATIYIWLDYSVTIVRSAFCQNEFYETQAEFNTSQGARMIVTLEYHGTGSKLIFLQLLADIPRYLCLAYISIKLPILLVKRIRDRKLTDRRLTREQRNLLYSSLPDSTESIYVKRLLNMHPPPLPTNRLASIFRNIYEWRDDFRFSSRVISVYASLLLMLFFLTLKACIQVPPFLDLAQTLLQRLLNAIQELRTKPKANLSSEDFPLPALVRPFYFAAFTSLILMLSQLIIMLVNIRRNLLQSFRGDDIELPRRQSTANVSYVTGNFHFAGYLIGYVVLGYLLLGIFLFVFGICVDAFITYGSVPTLESVLKLLIPVVLFPACKLYLNKFLGQYVFLQRHGEVLFVDNRRALMVFLYFNIFLDAFLGMIAAVLRLLKSIMGAILYMCRLDYSPLGRKLETMDAGFNAYCGFIYMECAHRHPVLLCFVSHLLRSHLYSTSAKRLSRARHKWCLAVFLVNNPELAYQRKSFLTRIKSKKMDFEQAAAFSQRKNIEIDDMWQRERF